MLGRYGGGDGVHRGGLEVFQVDREGEGEEKDGEHDEVL
jgi:hypothetical protein